MKTMKDFLDETACMHKHLCPRQVLGVRMGMYAGKLLDLQIPQTEKRLLTIAETDGCGVDGISVATNCWVGHRTLRIEDFGKLAAAFVDTQREKALRIVPRSTIRQDAVRYAPEGSGKWEGQLIGYQRMPDEALFLVQSIELRVPVAQIVSRAGRRVECDHCGEEIINEREVLQDGKVVCRACAGEAYYRPKEELASPELTHDCNSIPTFSTLK